MHTALQLSVRDVVHHAMEELSAHDAKVAQELVDRAWARMPKIAEFLTPNLVEKFIDLSCSIHCLPSISSEVASLRDCEVWFKEITLENHITLPTEEYRACAHRLMRNVFCFSEHDLADLDLGFYKAMMGFVRPMRDAITAHNLAIH
jgi:hypothetical protein